MFYGDEDVLLGSKNQSGFKKWSVVEFVLFSTHFGLLFVLFLLTCFADHRPPTYISSGKKRTSIENADAFNINGSVKMDGIKDDSYELKNVSNGEELDVVKPLVALDKKGSLRGSETDQAEAKMKESPELRASFLSVRHFLFLL